MTRRDAQQLVPGDAVVREESGTQRFGIIKRAHAGLVFLDVLVTWDNGEDETIRSLYQISHVRKLAPR